VHAAVEPSVDPLHRPIEGSHDTTLTNMSLCPFFRSMITTTLMLALITLVVGPALAQFAPTVTGNPENITFPDIADSYQAGERVILTLGRVSVSCFAGSCLSWA
jgi:hypothetical protein